MKKPINKFSIGVKISASISLVVLGLVLFQLFYFPSRQILQLRRALEEKATSLATFIAYEVSTSLEFDDVNTVKSAFQGASHDPDYIFAALFTNDKKLYFAHSKVMPKKELAGFYRAVDKAVFVQDESLLKIWVPVRAKKNLLGILSMGFSTQYITKERQGIILTTFLMSAIILIAGLAIALFVSSRLTKPIVRMTHAFRRMAEGDLQQPQIPATSSDETGELARAFNEMLTTLLNLIHTAKEVAQGNLRVTVTTRGDLADAFRNMLTMLRELSEKALEISEGELDLELTAKGDLADAFRQMIARQRTLIDQMAATARQLLLTANEFQKQADEQEKGAVQQSTSVASNQTTVEQQLKAAQLVSEAARDVLHNAEKSQDNSRLVSLRITELTAQAKGIAEFLQMITDVADQTELLALNAALEGSHAGEAGKGFSLVALQMQKLAENVMNFVNAIKELNDGIKGASDATIDATAESLKLADDTTQSVRQIVEIINQQKVGTEKLSTFMDDVGQIASQTSDRSKKIVLISHELAWQAEKLEMLIGQFTRKKIKKPTQLDSGLPTSADEDVSEY